jgi:hypothetical protein
MSPEHEVRQTEALEAIATALEQIAVHLVAVEDMRQAQLDIEADRQVDQRLREAGLK